MTTLEEILAQLEVFQKRFPGDVLHTSSFDFADECERAIPDLIALRDELRKLAKDWPCEFGFSCGCGFSNCRTCYLKRLLGEPPIANPKPEAEEPRT